MNSVTSGLGTGIGFGLGNRLFGGGGGASSAAQSQQPLTQPLTQSQQPSTSVDPCNEMKIRLFAMKESPVQYREDEERYDRLFEEYEKLCIRR